MAEECKDMYEILCKGNFKDLKDGQKEIIDILKGKNGNPGLIDDVRDNTKLRKYVSWMATIFIGAFIAQSVALLFFLIKDVIK